MEMCEILFVMYGSNVFSSVLLSLRSEMGLYEVPNFIVVIVSLFRLLDLC